MIYPGTDLKFKVSAVGRGMSLADCGFSVVVRRQSGKVVYAGDKQDMLTDGAGGYYFCLKDMKAGIYYAKMTMEKTDINFDGSYQHVTDWSYLCTIGYPEQRQHVPETDGLAVCYERVWTVNIGEGVYLCDVNGQPILDADGQPIILTEQGQESDSVKIPLTAAQLNSLLTGRNHNGTVDTLPEVIDAVAGLDEDTEYGVMTDGDVDDMMDRILS